MRIMIFWSYYEKYTQSLYEKDIHLCELPYINQLHTILEDNFGWPPALLKRLAQMGHTVEIIIVNSKSLQWTWARENGYEFSTRNWQYDIPLEQAKRFSPDVIWIGSIFNYFGDYLSRVKSYCKKIFAWVACPMPTAIDLSHIDCFLTSHTNFQDYFRSRDKDCEILLPAFNEEILHKIGNEERDIECSFVGALSWGHIQRIKTIRALADKTPLQIWGDRSKLISRGILKQGFISSYLSLYPIRDKMHPSVWGMDMYKILARSQITINVHGELASGLAGNMRMFEATGVGSLLITEDAPNIEELYQPGLELVTYKNTTDLIDIVNYYITHPQERGEIAKAGQRRTISNHNTMKRSNDLVEIFERYLSL